VVVVVVAVVIAVVIIVDVDVDIVVATGDVSIVVVISDFFGARMTNFNTRESVTTTIVRANKDMPVILTHRWRHYLFGPFFSGANLM